MTWFTWSLSNKLSVIKYQDEYPTFCSENLTNEIVTVLTGYPKKF